MSLLALDPRISSINAGYELAVMQRKSSIAMRILISDRLLERSIVGINTYFTKVPLIWCSDACNTELIENF